MNPDPDPDSSDQALEGRDEAWEAWLVCRERREDDEPLEFEDEGDYHDDHDDPDELARPPPRRTSPRRARPRPWPRARRRPWAVVAPACPAPPSRWPASTQVPAERSPLGRRLT